MSLNDRGWNSCQKRQNSEFDLETEFCNKLCSLNSDRMRLQDIIYFSMALRLITPLYIRYVK